MAFCGTAVLKVGFAWELVETPVLRPCPRPPESETLRVEPSKMCFNKPFGGDSDAHLSLKNADLAYGVLTYIYHSCLSVLLN